MDIYKMSKTGLDPPTLVQKKIFDFLVHPCPVLDGLTPSVTKNIML